MSFLCRFFHRSILEISRALDSMKPMRTLHDLIEEAKLRTVWWALCIFAVTYFLAHTSKSMWMNVPISILLVCGLRILFNEVEFYWKVRTIRQQTYLAHLEKKQIPVNDSRLSTSLPSPNWKRKIGSQVVEAAMDDFVNKILQDFVIDLWYSEITMDKEAPELIHSIIMDALGEVSKRVKEINLVDLLTRDIIDLIGDHFELFRTNQASIGVNVMGTLSFEERDERLKHHLKVSKELHPALISPESEYKVLQWIIGGVLATVLRPEESHCPLVRCIAREIVTNLVIQPIMNFASPLYINELIEYILAFINAELWGPNCQSPNQKNHNSPTEHPKSEEKGTNENPSTCNEGPESKPPATKLESQGDTLIDRKIESEVTQAQHAEWARLLEAATQRRTQVLMPENLDNMWCRGRHYKPPNDSNSSNMCDDKHADSDNINTNTTNFPAANKKIFKRSCITSDLRPQVEIACEPGYSEIYADNGGNGEVNSNNTNNSISCPSNPVLFSEGQHFSKLKCRVMGAFFEKLGSKSFAVYSIAVTGSDSNTWFVKRRYSNFERLHRQLKDISNYTLHLPPKKIFSSSTEDALVHQRCIQLNKYLQDLLSIANVAEQHEVWDFLSVSSKVSFIDSMLKESAEF